MPANGRLYWKVCGMREAANIRDVAALRPDFMGFIFYERSPRYAGEVLAPADLEVLSNETARVGVFVNAPIRDIEKTVERYNLDLVQLHGDENEETVRIVSSMGIGVIKVVSGNRQLDHAYMTAVEPLIDYWLLDFRTDQYGGTGKVFDRTVLGTYAFKKPILLSGGLNAAEVIKICKERHPGVIGVDVNSKVEVRPGLKDIELVNEIKNSLICDIR